MDFRDLTGRAAERIKAVFSKDNRFFYGTSDHHDAGYQEEAQQTPVQGVYSNAYAQPNYQQQQPYQQQPVYTQNSYQQTQQPQYQQYQQATPQQYMQQSAPQQNWQQQAYQEPVYQASPQQMQHVSPQQVQLNQQQIEQSGRNRRAAQHMQAPQPDNNIVQFPGTMPEQESRQMDAYVVNITNITGCRQAMTCLRKGQCTLVVMDQLIDKAEVRRYVDMLNGACFALGGTMTRLSLKVGFYILAPSGMMVYTDPVTASANAPQVRSQPAAQQQNAFPQQPAYQQPPVYQQQPVYGQHNVQQQAQPFQQPAQNPFAPPMNAAPLDQSRDSYDAQRFVQ